MITATILYFNVRTLQKQRQMDVGFQVNQAMEDLMQHQ